MGCEASDKYTSIPSSFLLFQFRTSFPESVAVNQDGFKHAPLHPCPASLPNSGIVWLQCRLYRWPACPAFISDPFPSRFAQLVSARYRTSSHRFHLVIRRTLGRTTRYASLFEAGEEILFVVFCGALCARRRTAARRCRRKWRRDGFRGWKISEWIGCRGRNIGFAPVVRFFPSQHSL
jgi:hypothetical protein